MLDIECLNTHMGKKEGKCLGWISSWLWLKSCQHMEGHQKNQQRGSHQKVQSPPDLWDAAF
jgi:hypothetical protein